MDIGEKLKSLIPNSQFAAGKKELVIRCPYCGHTSSAGKKHMYIGLSKDKPIMFNCFKCESGGIVNRNFINLLNINDEYLIQAIESHNKVMMKSRGNVYSSNHNKINKIEYNSFFINQDIIQDKIDYINNRLGSNISINEMMNMKIIFDFSYFKRQIMGNLRATKSDFERIQRDYVGFLSINNTSLSLRCIRQLPDNRFRYIIVKLYDTEDYNKAFSIPTNISVTSEKILVNICEGQFDILSIYNNLMNRRNGIYIASAGNKYTSVLQYIISKGIMNMELHLYFDNDSAGEIARKQIEYFIRNNIIFFRTSNIFAHVNRYSNEKDYGVPIDRINDFCTQIL